jgi:hypothetical protein
LDPVREEIHDSINSKGIPRMVVLDRRKRKNGKDHEALVQSAVWKWGGWETEQGFESLKDDRGSILLNDCCKEEERSCYSTQSTN